MEFSGSNIGGGPGEKKNMKSNPIEVFLRLPLLHDQLETIQKHHILKGLGWTMEDYVNMLTLDSKMLCFTLSLTRGVPE